MFYTWKTGKYLDDTTNEMSITGTAMKAHTEFRGIKQTELTRCRVAALAPGMERGNNEQVKKKEHSGSHWQINKFAGMTWKVWILMLKVFRMKKLNTVIICRKIYRVVKSGTKEADIACDSLETTKGWLIWSERQYWWNHFFTGRCKHVVEEKVVTGWRKIV